VSQQEQIEDARQQPSLLLASSSPRRRDILSRLGLPFRIVPADLDEDQFAREFQGSFPELVEALAAAKARAVAAAEPAFDGWILAADTTVILEGDMLSKPVDRADAARMLRLLRGRAHQVATGVAVYDPMSDLMLSGCVCTSVWMRPYSDAEIEAYVATGDPLDKAGGYAVQHEHFHPVERVEGCYLAVVGLPLCLATALLHRQGMRIPPRLPAPGSPPGCMWSSQCRLPLPPGAVGQFIGRRPLAAN
jgi:MAF protein